MGRSNSRKRSTTTPTSGNTKKAKTAAAAAATPRTTTGNSSSSSSSMWNSNSKKKKGSLSSSSAVGGGSSSSSSSSSSGFSETSANALFDELRANDSSLQISPDNDDDVNADDPSSSSSAYYDDPDIVTMEGVVHLGTKMNIDALEDVRILVLLWKMECGKEKPGHITRKEWIKGCNILQFDTWDKLTNNQQLMNGILDTGFLSNDEFKQFYKFCFQFNRTGTHRTLEKDLVIALLKMILKERIDHTRLHTFCTFLENNTNPQYLRITSDQWISYWDFCIDCPDLSLYDETTSAWPVLIDEYVEYYKQNNAKK